MGWEEALEIVVSRTKHERFRELCAGSHPKHEAYRQSMISQATGDFTQMSAFPPDKTQAVNLWRSIKEFVASGGKLAPKSVRAARQATCNVCPFWSGSRCRRCGCSGLKLYAAVAVCPDTPPRWSAYE